MFEIGDFAVYPGHGVGAIESIESMDMGGRVQDFYVLSILDTQMTIKIPMDNAGTAGMREVIGPDKIPEVYKILKSKKSPAIISRGIRDIAAIWKGFRAVQYMRWPRYSENSTP